MVFGEEFAEQCRTDGSGRNFNCEEVKSIIGDCCDLKSATGAEVKDFQCRAFEVNVCSVDLQEQQQLCRDGYAAEFYRKFPCYCDDRCLSKLGASIAGSIFGFSLVVGMIFVFVRHRRNKITDDEMERRLSIRRSEKPDPHVSQFSMNCFKWIPFAISVVISAWFLVSTILVIVEGGAPEVNVFEVSYMLISTGFMCFWLVANICLALNGINGFRKLKKEMSKDADDSTEKHSDATHHIVVLPNYCEEVYVMRNTILRLATQKFITVKKNITIVLAMEQGEEGYLEKGQSLREEFLPMFRDVIITCHPRGILGEQPGKSSNMKWAYAALERFADNDHADEANESNGTENKADSNGETNADEYFNHPDLVEKTVSRPDFAFDHNHTVVTLMDADALSHPRFISSLSKKFEEKEGNSKHLRFWQCPICFYENLSEVDFINRAVTIIFAFNEMANSSTIDLGLVGSKPCVPVNTYSMSWRLLTLIEGGDNFVVADESHNLFKAHWMSKGLARLEPIHLPISVYNVTSDKFLPGFMSRFTQIKRWMYGNAYEFSFWSSRYIGCSRSPGWKLPFLDKAPILWRLFLFSSFNLVQPLFFALYGLSWAFYLRTPYFQTLSTIFVTFIMTTFMIINCTIFTMHWFLVAELKIEGLKDWPKWKRLVVTIWDAIIGVGFATVFFVLFSGLAANAQLLFTGGLKWGTEGRAKKNEPGDEVTQGDATPEASIRSDSEKGVPQYMKQRSSLTVSRAKLSVRSLRSEVAS